MSTEKQNWHKIGTEVADRIIAERPQDPEAWQVLSRAGWQADHLRDATIPLLATLKQIVRPYADDGYLAGQMSWSECSAIYHLAQMVEDQLAGAIADLTELARPTEGKESAS